MTLAKERADHERTAADLQSARILLAQLEERLAAQEARNRDLASHTQSLEDKHQHASDALEHFWTQAQEAACARTAPARPCPAGDAG